MIVRVAAVTVAALLSVSCAPDGKKAGARSVAGCGPGVTGVAATGGWARAAPAQRPMSAAYVTLCNAGPGEDALIGATSPGVATIEIHETRSAQGVSGMHHEKEIVLPAGEAVTLAPGGRHLMLIGLLGPLDVGATMPITMQFRSGATVTVDLPVRDAAEGSR